MTDGRPGVTGSGSGAVLVVLVLATTVTAEAQDLEPRTYASTPVGLKLLLPGYTCIRGNVAFDASTPIKDAELTVHGSFRA